MEYLRKQPAVHEFALAHGVTVDSAAMVIADSFGNHTDILDGCVVRINDKQQLTLSNPINETDSGVYDVEVRDFFGPVECPVSINGMPKDVGFLESSDGNMRGVMLVQIPVVAIGAAE